MRTATRLRQPVDGGSETREAGVPDFKAARGAAALGKGAPGDNRQPRAPPGQKPAGQWALDHLPCETSRKEENDKADQQMNRIQSDQNQTRCPMMTSQEGPTLWEWCLKMMVTLSGKTFPDLQRYGTEVQICMVSPNLHHWSLCPPGRAVPCPCGYNGAITCV